ncbi:MAG TPA: biopolymer transporter ExbD [Rhizomicrobium sp.]|jgi:biopolymer transport protein ExbD|nr:biopolymer transporter ExbD [Rhizomicrobium sp.]
MAMAATTADGEVLVDINTTPLIDVMLVLLTLLILTLPIQTHAVKLDMPRPNTPPPDTTPVVVDLVIDFDGSITWDGQKLDREGLDTKLLDAANTKPTPPEIQINPNRLARYDTVAMVLADAQHLGVTHIGFTGIDQYN